jgi:endonuclease/exonuclease/phosphatase (EEP) superfamily protein YafD
VNRTARRGLLAGVGAGAAFAVHADRLRLDSRFPQVEVMALRPHVALAALVGAAMLAGHRECRPAAAVLGAAGLAGLGAVMPRAVRARRVAPTADDLMILNLNVLRGGADTGALATVIAREAPEFVVLPEAGPAFRDKLMALVDGLGYRSWVSVGPDVRESRGMTLLAARRAGELRVESDDDMRCRHLRATGGILGGRSLFAVHVTAPRDRERTAAWRDDLAVLSRWCRAEVAPIVAGDLNATLDHSAFRAGLHGCRSAAAGTGRGLAATYPSSLPRALGIQIDHILVPPGTTTSRFEVVDVAGSDHRAVLAQVRLPTTEGTGRA